MQEHQLPAQRACRVVRLSRTAYYQPPMPASSEQAQAMLRKMGLNDVTDPALPSLREQWRIRQLVVTDRLSLEQAAERCGRSVDVVRGVVEAWEDTSKPAAALIRAGALNLAAKIVQCDDPALAADVLERIEALPPKRGGASGGVTIVNTVAGMAGLPPIQDEEPEA